MENEKKNINWLKLNLYNTVKEFDEKYIEIGNLDFKYSILKSISDTLNVETVKSQLFELNEQLMIVYGLEDGKRLIDELASVIFSMDYYQNKISKDQMYLEQYNKLTEKLNSFKEMIDKDMLVSSKLRDMMMTKYPLEKYKKYRSIISKLKYDQIIDSETLETIKQYLNEKELNDIEQVQLFEFIKLNNARISRDRGVRHSQALDGKEVLRIINIGLPVYEKTYIDSIIQSKRIDAEALAYLNTIINADNVEQILDELDISNYRYDEKQRFIVDIILGIQDKLLELRELISSKDFYLDVGIRDEIIRDYKSLSYKHKLMDKYYEDLEEEVIVLPNSKPENVLIFLEPEKSVQGKTYFEKDLEKIPREFYAIFAKLLKSFRFGTSKKVVDLFTNDNSDKYKRFFKLKDYGHGTNRGKSRIVCRQLKDNYYLVLGGFVKKGQTADNEYDSIINRYRNIESTNKFLEENEQVVDRIISYLEDVKSKNDSEIGIQR